MVNRATRATDGLSAEAAVAGAERLESGPAGGSGVTAGLLRLHADRMRRAAREVRLAQRFRAAHPHVPTVVVPALSTDVHDLDGLREIGSLLAGG